MLLLTWESTLDSRATPLETLRLYHRGRLVGTGECLCVHTLTYRGLWIEGLATESQEARHWLARAIVERAKALDLDQVGYLAPRRATPDFAEAPDVLALVRGGYRIMGSYFILVAEIP